MGAITTEEFRQMTKTIDKTVDAVLVAIDYSMNFKKLALASLYVQLGRPLFATNKDNYIRVDDFKLPGAGTCVSQV
jgi:ribonucleotide monophosphatase NagD (HAD superfamily)